MTNNDQFFQGLNLFAIQESLLNGGKKPLKNSHSVIDRPESVNLVKPPTTIIADTKKNININQYNKYVLNFVLISVYIIV